MPGIFSNLIFFLQDSFVIPRDQDNRNGDIEMGVERQMNSGELGLENFFKQVPATSHNNTLLYVYHEKGF